ncbi:16S rRNA (guanine(527)-N(7))-methyltransferase RsmG [Haloactinopolyspora alba]|uniref:16S rRNA (guanine(527)-N(7))-methyltransferase RsmG n=1 Tax=Haloactinopolyspora alba TaxID=648780 RepID=UPI003B84B23F
MTSPPEPPEQARELFGESLPTARAYVEWLAGAGIERGLLGPREIPRLWDRHVLNSVAISVLVEPGATVADVGSGAGLPGVPLAVLRPDLHVTLVEPLLRRSEFLAEVVTDLGIRDRVSVLRTRAEEVRPDGGFDVVTARAVAPMDKLARWTLPLLRPGGRLLALKGRSVAEELGESAASLAKMGAESWTVEEVGSDAGEPAARVAVVTLGRTQQAQRTPPTKRTRDRRGRQRRKNR